MKRALCFAAATLLAAGCSASPSGEDEPLGLSQESIINGQSGGLSSVGALEIRIGTSKGLCSGTLVAPDWMLTAAHCFSAGDGLFVSAADVTAYFSNNGLYYNTGTPHEVDKLYIHPLYVRAKMYAQRSICSTTADCQASETCKVVDKEGYKLCIPNYHDLALVKLKTQVRGAKSIPINDSFATVQVGTPVTIVGYGKSLATSEASAGFKRTGTTTISEVWSDHYIVKAGTQRTCKGDSGGPYLYMGTNTQPVLVGVVGGGADSVCGDDQPVRLDVRTPWIEYIMSNPAVPVTCDPGATQCGAGACVTFRPEGKAFLDNYCYPSSGIDEDESCDSNRRRWGFTAPCKDGAVCVNWSAGDGQKCSRYCEHDNECLGSESCMIKSDGVSTTGLCKPSAGCNMLGGDCLVGTTCALTQDESTNKVSSACFPSDGAQEGAPCNTDQGYSIDPEDTNANLPCGDGLVCVSAADSTYPNGYCFRICTTDADCTPAQRCWHGDWDNIPSASHIGVCGWVDDDDDGYMKDEDCDDSNSAVHPGAVENFYDGVDNDCDGMADIGRRLVSFPPMTVTPWQGGGS